MKSSCIRTPENNRYIQIHEWQINFCQNSHCAALLLSFFINWHEWKLKNDQYYFKANNISESHGDGRPHSENAYLFFTMEDFIEGTMNFYGKNAINEALQLLISLNVLTTHKNPNPRYHFDKTKYFQFYPSVCNRWIAENYSVEHSSAQFNAQPIDYIDTPKEANRLSENNRRSAEIGKPVIETGQPITNTTNKLIQTNINKLINTKNDFCDETKKRALQKNPILGTQSEDRVQAVITALVDQGFPLARLQYPDTTKNINAALQAGASINMFMEAYLDTCRIKKSESFAFNYLLKVVKTRLEHRKSQHQDASSENTPERNQSYYESDFSKSMDWMGDLLD